MNEDSIAELKRSLRGTLIQPGDPDYDEARKVHNGMIHKKPRLIARCTDVADVIRSVNFGRDNNLLVSIRGGGHNAGGLGICDDGLVIDLAPIKYTRVDPAARTVTVGGGCVWGDVDHATHAFGLATPSGIISTTGVGGLTLGGGVGHLTRKCGLSIDNLLSADLVLANGEFVKASADENPDLYWALRGGGGNFGVVTSFLFRMHPVSNVVAGPTFWSLEDAAEVMRAYREFLPAAPRELDGWFATLTVPPVPLFPDDLHGRKVAAIIWCHIGGDEEEAARAMAPMLEVTEPLMHGAGPMPFTAIQSVFDPLYPKGLQWYWRADFVRELPDEAIARHVEYAEALPTPHSTMHLYPIDGAVHDVSPDDTPFSYRDATWAEVIVGVDPDPANADLIR